MSHHHSKPNDSATKIVPEFDQPGQDNLVEEQPFIYCSPELPPGIASEFLEHVYRFEKAWQEAKTVNIYELLGKPFYLKEEELDDEVLEQELQRILGLMQSKQMTVEAPSGKTPREVYLFITEFLFGQEIEDVQLEGLSKHFIFNDDEDEEDVKPAG